MESIILDHQQIPCGEEVPWSFMPIRSFLMYLNGKDWSVYDPLMYIIATKLHKCMCQHPPSFAKIVWHAHKKIVGYSLSTKLHFVDAKFPP